MDEITKYSELRTAQELENEWLFIQFAHSEEKQANLQVDVEKRDSYYWIYHQYNLSDNKKINNDSQQICIIRVLGRSDFTSPWTFAKNTTPI